ncbi:MAG: T9SS type A sorting domain-containing protein [Saprospiraceae bacterium]|nr:T9SS type A sorting domain-containing protein [Saprospiraceae bacterium]
MHCDLNGLEDVTTAPVTPVLTIDNCTFGTPPITLENPRWYAFVAGTSDIQFDIKATQCTGTNGLEAAVVSGCQLPYKAITCAPLNGTGPFGTSSLFALGLTVGQVYYLVVDGINADVCKFTIQVTTGSTIAPELGNLAPIEGLTDVCPGATVNYTIPPVTYALTYVWTAPAGSKINGGSNVRILPATSDQATNVTVEFGTQGGNLCVTASNVCDTAKTTCIQITNQPLPIVDLPDLTICFEELPFVWEEQPNNFISTAGTYTFTSTPYESYLGCDSLVRQKITALPRKFKNLPLTYLCEPECLKVGDYEFCETGTYQESLTAENGCDSTVNFTIINIPVRAGIKTPDTITCRDPSVVLTIDSLTTTGNSVLYKWINLNGAVLSNTSSVTVSSAGPFFLIVTNNLGGRACPDTAEVTVPVNNTPPVSNAGPNRTLNCETPQLQLQGSGSTGPQYSYLWIALNGGNIVSGASTLTPTVNAVGTYRLRVTNQINGCTATDNTIVTASVLPPAVSATGGTFTCAAPNVTLGFTSNASSGSDFSWSGPGGFASTLPNPVVSTPGDYVVVITEDSTGCSNTAVATVVANTAAPGATATGGTLTCLVSSITLNGNTTATGATYAWSGPNGFSSSSPTPTAQAAGPYVLTVTGTNGCQSTATATVQLNNTPPGATLATGGNLNCNNTAINITATSTAPAGSTTHLWTRPDGTTASTGSIPVLSATAPGVYSVVITDTENGCTSTSSATIVQNQPVAAALSNSANVLCFGQQNGNATVSASGGTGAYTYLWNNTQNTANLTNVGGGTYTVTITDSENCTATVSVSIVEPSALSVNTSSTPQLVNGGADGTASAAPAGGTTLYTYLWSNSGSTPDISGLLPGSYTVTITDANGCTAVSVASVSAYDCTIAATVEASDVSCFDANNGEATVVTTAGQAPFTYLWSTADQTPSIGNLPPGTYTVVVTDAANCPEEIAFTISEPNPLNANATSTDMSGQTSNDGTAAASPTGGTPPYTFLWSNDSTSASLSGLSAGDYTVTVTDTHGCTDVQVVSVLPGDCGGAIANFVTTPVACNGDSTGVATVVLNGGASPFVYVWSSGGSAETEASLPAGTYTVTVTDNNACEIIAAVTLTDPALLTLSLDTVVTTPCPDLPQGSATVSAGGGTNPLDITWSDGQIGPVASDLVAGTYTVSVVDKNDCTLSLEVVVAALDEDAPVIVNTPLVAPLGTAGNVTLSVQSLGLDVSDNCGISEVTFVPNTYNCSQLGPHDVVVTATDETGNVSVETITVTVVDNLPPTLVCPASIIRCFGDDIVQYAAPVATDNCLGNGGSFNLVSGLPSGSQFSVGTTTNTYTYTDADGNVGACTFEVTILDEFVVTLNDTISDIGNQMIGQIRITASGSLSPYTYQWFKVGSPAVISVTEDLTNVGAGEYYVVVTDEVGCTTVSDTFVISNLVGTQDLPEWAGALMIVPNPTSGNLSVIFPDQFNQEVDLTVYDLTGRRIQQQVASTPKKVEFNLSDLPDGLYMMLIRVDKQLVTRKIVISK